MLEDLLEPTEDGGLLLRVHVSPGAGRSAVVGRHGDALKLRVAAPPTGGRANDACVALLAGVLGVGADAVAITSGATSRTKRVKVAGIEVADARRLLEEAVRQGSGIPRGGSTFTER